MAVCVCFGGGGAMILSNDPCITCFVARPSCRNFPQLNCILKGTLKMKKIPTIDLDPV